MKTYFKIALFVVLLLAWLAFVPALISSDQWEVFGLGVVLLIISPLVGFFLGKNIIKGLMKNEKAN
ncbi:hypothetical protein [Vibrio phage CKB-S1]|nr:hypothetical protein [Vibrio phage CKB-S1]